MELTTMLLMLGSGFVTTLQIFFLTLAGALPLGLVVSFGRRSKFKPLSLLIQGYISIMRGTPLMLQLFVIYFGPFYIFGISINDEYRFIATIIAFVLNYAAYFAEIYRGGIESIAPGQYEAASVLGYSRIQTFFKIVFPQVIKRILPALTNEVITLVKDTSLAFAIGLAEMFTTAKAIAASQRTMAAFVAAGIMYYVFNAVVAFLMKHVEKKMNYYHD